jgi:RNA polymerase sigma-70 factor (ECF subfamily)
MISMPKPESSQNGSADDALALLCRRAGDGDTAAFEALYRATVGRIYGLCLRMTANISAAEDATQATFIQAWRNLDGFRGEARVSTWLHRIAVNEVLGQQRREARHQHEPEDVWNEQASDNPNSGAPLDLDLERAIAALPEQARNVFVLCGVYGYGHRDAAGFLGIAEGTSKAHYHTARRKLREALAGAET